VEIVRLNIKPVFLLDPLSTIRGKKSGGSWSMLDGLSDSLTDVDVIDTSELYTFFTYQCLRLKELMEKPLVVSVIESIPHHISSWLPPYSLLSSLVAERADLIIALTKRSRDYLLSLGVDKSRIEVIYPGFDLEMFKPAGERQDGKVRILFVGQLSQYKGLDLLLEAFMRLAKNHDKKTIELWICGKGPLENTVRACAKRLENIRYFGSVDWHELPAIYNQCHIFCSPSVDNTRFGIRIWEEQLGMVLVEAMASGLPVVASDCGAIPEILGTNNLIVNQSSKEMLHSSLEALVHDPDRRLSIGEKNRARAEEMFEPRVQCQKYASSLSRLL
jgi:colanic acid/amylovoran biosynthesis glycosyltransferase